MVGSDPFGVKEATEGNCSSGHGDAKVSVQACACPMTLSTKLVWAGRIGSGGLSYL